MYGNFDAPLRPGSNYGQEYGMPYNYSLSKYEDPPVPYDYETFVDDYLHVVEPDILLVDLYPFCDETNDETTEQYLRDRSYYRCLDLVRAAAMKANIPYWLVVQSADYGGAYLPSGSDLTMEVYSALAYGFTGISYFVFDNLGNYGDGDGGLLRYADPNENSYVCNDLYYDAQRVNAELAHLGRTLKLLKSTKTRYILGTHLENSVPVANALPLAAVEFNPATDDPYITSITATNLGTIPDQPAGDLLIGYFTPFDETLDGPTYQNETYFMITNLLRERNVAYHDARQAVHIEFDLSGTTITQLQRLNRTDGHIETVPLVPLGNDLYSLDLVLTGGELFKYQTGAVFIRAIAAPKLLHLPPGPGLNAPFEDDGDVDDYGVNQGVAGVTWNTFAGNMGIGSYAYYSTSLYADNSTVTAMPTDSDWVFKITYCSNGSNYNDQAFVLKAHEGQPTEQNVIDLYNNGSGTWSLRCATSAVATGLAFDDGAFHTLIVHYAASSQTLDAYLDDKLIASDFTASHSDYAIDYIQLQNHRDVSSYDYFHGIQIAQMAPESDSCGDPAHPYPNGDLNFDCLVDLADLAAMAENWMTNTAP